jgi:hypothetical protein
MCIHLNGSLLASHDLAWQLHYSSQHDANSSTMGTLGMVIMDFVPGSNAYELYSKTQLPSAIYDEVTHAITELIDLQLLLWL